MARSAGSFIGRPARSSHRAAKALLGLAPMVLACTAADDGGDTNPFGSTAPTSTITEASTNDASTNEATTTAATATAATATEATTTGTPSDSSSGSPPSTSDGPATDGTGNPGDGQLGGCIGTGAWTSCAMYCEANLDVCVEAGCGGATVVYYKNVGDCTSDQADSSAATPCNDPFAMGGGISFARCCCA